MAKKDGRLVKCDFCEKKFPPKEIKVFTVGGPNEPQSVVTYKICIGCSKLGHYDV